MISDARRARDQAARDLADSQRQLAKEQTEVVQPLLRLRKRWLTENHVTQELIRQLREANQ